VRRLAFVIIAGLLTFSASGAPGLLVLEPCTNESAGDYDGTCPPTCLTCGCCARGVEPAAVALAATPDATVAHPAAILPGLPETDPRDILHVPRGA
jgi:hypothetical protein